jgi:hypothetical protein
MAYPVPLDEADLLARKEFYQLKSVDRQINDEYGADYDDERAGSHLQLHTHQLFASTLISPHSPYFRLHLMHGTGSGKCHAKGTAIMLYSGLYKSVENIQVGELLMGDDGTPRTVLSLATGLETMVEITAEDGWRTTCNLSHILCLRNEEGVVAHVSAAEYIDKRAAWNGWGLYRSAIERHGLRHEIDNPYALGLAVSIGDLAWEEVAALRVVRFAPVKTRTEFMCGLLDGCAKSTEAGYILPISDKNTLLILQEIAWSMGWGARMLRIDAASGGEFWHGKRKRGFDAPQSDVASADDNVHSSIVGVAPAVDNRSAAYPSRAKHSLFLCIRNTHKLSLLLLPERCFPPQNLLFRVRKKRTDRYYGFEISGNRRYLLHGYMVTHNTLCGVAVSQRFIQIYKQLYDKAASAYLRPKRYAAELDKATPSVFVLGFGGAKAGYIRELLRYPEFGFVSAEERDELLRLRTLAMQDQRSYANYKELHTRLKRRITSKERGGFYKFYGYDEFVNRLFESDELKLTDLESRLLAARAAGDMNARLEDAVDAAINAGEIRVNERLVSMFDNALLICDEIHNTYNSSMKNNRGVAIQYLLDRVPTLRFLSLSATPINNSPTECVELLNYLRQGDEPKLSKSELFYSAHHLRENALEIIARRVKGRISFLQDANPAYYPERIFLGEPVAIGAQVADLPAGTILPYLLFTPCPMSAFHQATLMNIGIVGTTEGAAEADDTSDNAPDDSAATGDLSQFLEDEPEHSHAAKHANDGENGEDLPQSSMDTTQYARLRIPADGYAIYDIAFPNPDSEQVGVYKSADLKARVADASESWWQQVGIMPANNTYTGSFLARQNIEKYSTKYAQLLDLLQSIWTAAQGQPQNGSKVMIYHTRVRGSGVLLIAQMLMQNGVLDEYGEPTDNTKCMLCGRVYREHDAQQKADKDENSGDTQPHKLDTAEQSDSARLHKLDTAEQSDSAQPNAEQLDSAQPHKLDTAEQPDSAGSSHAFQPCRFIITHSEIDRNTLESSLARFDAPENATGSRYNILLGSSIIEESYDFKDIQHLFVLSLPVNIPTLIQVFGRCIRKYSHRNLPPERRKVYIRILVSTVNLALPHNDPISPEVYRYLEKLVDYRVIQQIEREFNRNAIDAPVHRDIVMPESLKREYFMGTSTPVDKLGNLYFEPAVTMPRVAEPNTVTFDALGYGREEADYIFVMLKRLFLRSPVWTEEALWRAVLAPPFASEYNSALFKRDNFALALQRLVSPGIAIGGRALRTTRAGELQMLFDPRKNTIYKEGREHNVIARGVYYCLCPVVSQQELFSRPADTHTRDKERAMLAQSTARGQPLVDFDSFARDYSGGATDIPISNFLAAKRAESERDGLHARLWALCDGSANNASSTKSVSKDGNCCANINALLWTFPAAFQSAVLAEAVQHAADIAYSRVSDGGTNELNRLDRALLSLFTNLGAVVHLRDLERRDVWNQLDPLTHKLERATPIGYDIGKITRVYDPARSTWLEIGRVSAGRYQTFEENKTIIGYLADENGYIKFKLRKPIHKIKKKTQEDLRIVASRRSASRGHSSSSMPASHWQRRSDTRLIERGIVCTTKNKKELLKLLIKLDVSVAKLSFDELKIKSLCAALRTKLLELEMLARRKRTDAKYVYGWWNEEVLLHLLV